MDSSDDPLARLLKHAAAAPAKDLTALSPQSEADIVRAWRSTGSLHLRREFAFDALLVRGAALALTLMLVVLGLNLTGLADSQTQTYAAESEFLDLGESSTLLALQP